METLEDYLEYFVRHSLLEEDEIHAVGNNSCPYDELKVAFDGYGDDGEDKNSESYVIYIHKDSADEGFVFPEHDSNGLHVVHRPEEEAYVYAWYDKENDAIDIINVDETIGESELSTDFVKDILSTIYKRLVG